MTNLRILFLLVIAFACSQKKKSGENAQSASLKSGETSQTTEQRESKEKAVLSEQESTWKDAVAQKLPTQGYHTKLIKDGKGMLYSKENFEGLWYCDLATKNITIITEKDGAGYQPQWVEGKIVYEVKGRMKYLEAFDFDKKRMVSIEESEKSQSPARYAMAENDQTTARLSKDLLGIELVSATGEVRVIKPQSEGNYIFASLSPNGKMVLYAVGGLGGFIADLSGKTVMELGNVDAPKWISNSQLVFAESKDDGMRILDSQVFVFDLKSKSRHPLKVKDVALFEPSVSEDGELISAHSSEGDIYIFKKQ